MYAKLRASRKLRAGLAWLAVIVWMAVIFSMSAQTVEQSRDTSTEVTKEVAPSVVPDYVELTESEKKDAVAELDIVVRKLAHFSEFALLGALLCIALTETRAQGSGVAVAALLASLIASLYAAGDELHQLFVPGRIALFKDYLIDTAGGFFGAALALVAIRILRRIRAERHRSREPEPRP